MSNWKESIRQAEELEQEKVRVKRELAEKKEEEINLALGILSRLKVEDKLNEIKRDVWEAGEVKDIEQEIPDADCYRLKKKGYSLVYSYREPGGVEKEVASYRNRLELWKYLDSWGIYDEQPRNSPRKKFSPHIEKTPDYAEVYRMKYKSEALSVYLEFKLKRWESSGVVETISLVVNSTSLVLATGPAFALGEGVEGAAATFLDKALLDDCLNRKKNGQLPTDIEQRVQQRIAQIPPLKLRYT